MLNLLSMAASMSGGAPPPPAITWNPSDKDAGITLSNGDLSAGWNAGARPGAGATYPKTTGAWYFELFVDNWGGAFSWLSIGISPPGTARNVDLGQNADCFGYAAQGAKYFDGSFGGYVWASYTTNDVIGCAFDLDNNTIEFFKNNTSQGQVSVSFDQASYAPAITMSNTGTLATLRTLTAEFTYTPPTGFTPLGE